MRILLSLSPVEDFLYDSINKHTVQGFIYSLLRDTNFAEYHDSAKFKFFCFSDIFPIDDFKAGAEKHLLISSPNREFIEAIRGSLKAGQNFKLGGHEVKIRYKVVQPKLSSRFISASPIVLYENNQQNLYYSFERNKDLNFFLQRLKDNAVKKYNAFYSEEYNLSENIFDRLIFRKETAAQIKKGDAEFIMDCGLGEKNSLGFGFINPMK